MIESTKPPVFKDSFSSVNGDALGYTVLFEAEWMWIEPTQTVTSLNWRRVMTDADLCGWERGWSMNDPGASAFPRQFPSSLLRNPNISFYLAFVGEELIAGCALNFTPPVVGLSNVFGPNFPLDRLWMELFGFLTVQFPGIPVVGYENGEYLEAAIKAGAERIGRLKVWQR